MAKTTPSRAKSKDEAPKANTVKWWLMKLPEPIRSKALKACDNPDRKVNSVAHAIADGFSWVDTKDGHAYWTKVSNRAMAGEFDPKKSPPKSKTKAPKKALTPIEKRIISLEVRLSAGAKVRGLQDARITKLELYGTANVDSWIEQHDNRIKAIEGRLDKLASPTVAVEEKWVPKVGDYFVPVRKNEGWPGWRDEMESLIGTVRKVEGFQPESRSCIAAVGCVLWDWAVSCIRPATPEEIAAHEAKVKAEAQSAEDAKLVFGARVKQNSDGLVARIAMDKPTPSGKWMLSVPNEAHVIWLDRHEFTLLP